MTRSEQVFAQAQNYIPGGVNSPVRAFQSVGSTPRMIARADGVKMYDIDGREYVDFVGSWGPMILGHNHPAIREAVIKAAQNGLSFGAATEIEVDMAKLICSMVPNVEMIRMVNSGTEAVMSAVRAARGFTGRNRIIKFAGCYHGHSDAMLVRAGSGVMTSGIPDSAGVPAACAADTLTAVYNDLASVEAIFAQNRGEVAAVIVEPVAANMGVVEPAPGFLTGLREICDKNGALLIFDEVITGFRLALGGAQEYFGVRADLVTFGKIVGAGMPVGAYGGRRDVMSIISPKGSVYQAGTLSGNPVAMAAGLTQLTILRDTPAVYQKINALGDFFRQEMAKMAAQTGAPVTVTGVGSLSCIFFTSNPVHNDTDAKNSDTALFAKYFLYMLDKGFYFAPSQFEAIFLSAAHTEENIRDAVQTARCFFQCGSTVKEK